MKVPSFPWRRALGTRADWRLVRPPRPGPFTPGLRWVGPIVVVLTLLGTWPAFAGTAGEDGDVSFALYIGSIAIGDTFELPDGEALKVIRAERRTAGADTLHKVYLS